MNIYTREELLNPKNCTLGDLKRFAEKHGISDDAIIMIERIEDRYYDGFSIAGMRGTLKDGTYGILPPGTKSNGWRVYPKRAESSYYMIRHNERVQSGYYNDKEQFPDIVIEELRIFTEEEIDDARAQYTPAWCPALYKDEGEDILFIDLHS